MRQKFYNSSYLISVTKKKKGFQLCETGYASFDEFYVKIPCYMCQKHENFQLICSEMVIPDDLSSKLFLTKFTNMGLFTYM